MVVDPDFKDYMVRKIDEKVDVSSLEAERNQVREQLRQVMGAKKKLTEMLDRLDVNDKHYDRKYQDMHFIEKPIIQLLFSKMLVIIILSQ